jgi:hypothetical protein
MGLMHRPPQGRRSTGAVLSSGVVAVIALALIAVPILLFNQHHSGDPGKVRRELRKF